jgi:hypothetical protein
VQESLAAVEQPDDGRINVPCLVCLSCSETDLGLGRMNTQAGTTPTEAVDECVPGRRGSEDLSEPLREDGEGSGWNMAVLLGPDHLSDGFDFV